MNGVSEGDCRAGQRARQVKEQGRDYVLSLKANHGAMFETASRFFERMHESHWQSGSGPFARPVAHRFCQSVERGHGRIEVRRCFVVEAGDWLREEAQEEWAGLQSLACIQSERASKGKITTERRFYLTSLSSVCGPKAARQILRAARAHRGIKNRLHWVLDVAFAEDDSRIRCGNAPENMAALRRLSLNLLRQEKTQKVGVGIKRSIAGWGSEYLLKILAAGTEAANATG